MWTNVAIVQSNLIFMMTWLQARGDTCKRCRSEQQSNSHRSHGQELVSQNKGQHFDAGGHLDCFGSRVSARCLSSPWPGLYIPVTCVSVFKPVCLWWDYISNYLWHAFRECNNHMISAQYQPLAIIAPSDGHSTTLAGTERAVLRCFAWES